MQIKKRIDITHEHFFVCQNCFSSLYQSSHEILFIYSTLHIQSSVLKIFMKEYVGEQE